MIESQPESLDTVTERIEKVDIKGDEQEEDTQADSDKEKSQNF